MAKEKNYTVRLGVAYFNVKAEDPEKARAEARRLYREEHGDYDIPIAEVVQVRYA